MKNYLPWILLAILAIAYLVYNQRFIQKIGTPSYVQEFSIASKYLDRDVKIWVYLPPNYLDAVEPLPVLYMHDGQNLFDKKTSFAGEWLVDESLDKLYKEKKFQLVVVGIENGGEKRIDELTPYKNPKHGGGKADDYLTFMEKELFPEIESKFNVSNKKEERGMMGSSLGGLLTFYAAFEKSDVYSNFGVYSPSFWFNPEIFDLPRNKKLNDDIRMIMMIGDMEENEHHKVLKMKGILEKTQDFYLQTNVIPYGEHNEKFWSEHFKQDGYTLFNQEK